MSFSPFFEQNRLFAYASSFIFGGLPKKPVSTIAGTIRVDRVIELEQSGQVGTRSNEKLSRIHPLHVSLVQDQISASSIGCSTVNRLRLFNG
jgi:hypothetical protein